jgi:hypothetical protein
LAKIDHVLNGATLIVIAVSIITIGHVVGRLDGFFFPVSRVTLFEIVGEVENDALVAGRFDKLRDCDFVRSEWYKEGHIYLDFERVDEVRERPRGDNHPWGVLRMDASPATIKTGIRALNLSRCSIFGIPLPWLTVTVAYDGIPAPLENLPAVKGDRPSG